MVTDVLQGCFVVGCTLCAFISLVWLREQVLHGGGPDWLEDGPQAALDRVVEQAMEGRNNGGGAAQQQPLPQVSCLPHKYS